MQVESLLSIHPASSDNNNLAGGIEEEDPKDLHVIPEAHQQDQQRDAAIDEEAQNPIIEQDAEDEGFDESFPQPESDTSIASVYEECRSTATSQSTRSSPNKYPLALLEGEVPDWFKALDVESPKQKYTPRSQLEWLNLGVQEEQILFAMMEEEYSDSSEMEIYPHDESAFSHDFEEGLSEIVSEEPDHYEAAEDITDEPAEDQVDEDVDYEAESFPSEWDVESTLAAPLTVIDEQYESSSGSLDDSTPLSSQGFVPTHSSMSNASGAEKEPNLVHGPADTESEPASKEPMPEYPSPESHPEISTACNRITKLAAEEAAAWKDVSVGLRALAPFLRLKLDFHICEDAS